MNEFVQIAINLQSFRQLLLLKYCNILTFFFLYAIFNRYKILFLGC